MSRLGHQTPLNMDFKPEVFSAREAHQRNLSANRRDRQQPIIIQNFEMATPGQLRHKRKAHLSAANLFLTPVSLSRQTPPSTPFQTVATLEDNESQSKLKHEASLIKEGRFWTPSVEAKPVSRKKVTFSEDCNPIRTPLKTSTALKYVPREELSVVEHGNENERHNTLNVSERENTESRPTDVDDSVAISAIANVNGTTKELNQNLTKTPVNSSVIPQRVPLDLANGFHENNTVVRNAEGGLDSERSTVYVDVFPFEDIDANSRTLWNNGAHSDLSFVANGEKIQSTPKRVSFKTTGERTDSNTRPDNIPKEYTNYHKDSWYEREKLEHLKHLTNKFGETDSDVTTLHIPRSDMSATNARQQSNPLRQGSWVKSDGNVSSKAGIYDSPGRGSTNTSLKSGSKIVKLTFLRDESIPSKPLESKDQSGKHSPNDAPDGVDIGLSDLDIFKNNNRQNGILKKDSRLKSDNTESSKLSDCNHSHYGNTNSSQRDPATPSSSRPLSQGEMNTDFLMKMYSSSGDRKSLDETDHDATPRAAFTWANRNRKLSKSNTVPDLLNPNQTPRKSRLSSRNRVMSMENISFSEEKERDLLKSTQTRRPSTRGAWQDGRQSQRSVSASRSRDEIWRDQRNKVHQADRHIFKGNDHSKILDRTPLNRRLEEFIVFSTPCPRLSLVLERAKAQLF